MRLGKIERLKQKNPIELNNEEKHKIGCEEEFKTEKLKINKELHLV